MLAMTMTIATNMDARILVHGHRGARAVRPENTLPAFEYALKAGVDVLELDLAVTKDNVVVVSHDPEMHPAICTGPTGATTKVIREMTLAELKQWDCGAKVNPDFPKQTPVPGTRVPTLDEVFQLAAKTKVEFNIETKIFASKPQLTPEPKEFARLVLEVVRKYKLESRVILQSFDNRTLIAMAELAPGIRRSMLTPSGPGDRGKDWVELCREAANAQIISPHYRLVTPEKVAAAHKAGLVVVPWTANDEAEWAKLVAARVDAIISDDPAALIAFLRRAK